MINKSEVFFESNIQNVGNVSIIEAKGIHFFKAMSKTKDDSSFFLKYLLLEIVYVNGEKITISQLDNMLIKDVSYLTTVVSQLLDDGFKEGI